MPPYCWYKWWSTTSRGSRRAWSDDLLEWFSNWCWFSGMAWNMQIGPSKTRRAVVGSNSSFSLPGLKSAFPTTLLSLFFVSQQASHVSWDPFHMQLHQGHSGNGDGGNTHAGSKWAAQNDERFFGYNRLGSYLVSESSGFWKCIESHYMVVPYSATSPSSRTGREEACNGRQKKVVGLPQWK